MAESHRDIAHRAVISDVSAVYSRREPLFEKCSRFEVFLAEKNSIEDDSSLLAASLRRFTSVPSFFCCLTTLEISKNQAEIIAVDVDAVELRLDLVGTENVASKVSYVRKLFPDLQLIVTLRSVKEGGNFSGESDEYKRMLRKICRARPDWVDVELAFVEDDREIQEDLYEWRDAIRFICSYHQVNEAVNVRKFQDVVRPRWSTVGKVAGAFSAHHLHFREVAERHSGKPIIAVGDKMSRIQNKVMTPVTHPSLPPAAPNQTTALWLHQKRIEIFNSTAFNKKFFLFGSPIEKSPSPAMHNLLFSAAGRSHWNYEKFETSRIDEILRLLKTTDFGGASVTIPLKEAVFAWATSQGEMISPLARRAQAVNTIVRRHGSLFFDNTDVLAIREVIAARLSETRGKKCLVIGTGGAARGALVAAENLGMETFLLGRDSVKTAALASEFTCRLISQSGNCTNGRAMDNVEMDVMISCVPGDAQVDIRDFSFTTQTIVVEMAYNPRWTKFLAAVGDKCVVVPGSEILAIQGLAQSRLWTGDEELVTRMRAAVMNLVSDI